MNRRIVSTHLPYVPYLGDGDPCTLMAVLLMDMNTHRKIAYIGIVSSGAIGETADNVDNAIKVSNRGRKLSYEEAMSHWPSLIKMDYYQ